MHIVLCSARDHGMDLCPTSCNNITLLAHDQTSKSSVVGLQCTLYKECIVLLCSK